jgi:hypothetical protein
VKNIYISKNSRGSVIIILTCVSFLFYAFSTGITGVSPKNGDGCTCHSSSPTTTVMVQINGPDTLIYNQTAVYTVTISGGPLQRAGTNIAASSGALSNLSSDLQVIGDELTHTAPKLPSGGVVTFSFNYTAPSTMGNQTIFAAGNSVNFNGSNEGDQWNFAVNKAITVVPFIPVELASFSAEVSGSQVLLEWTTATENNNSGFEILRSMNNIDWKNLSFIKGYGNSTEVRNYSYTDKQLSAGKYFYRLKQYDLDGSFTYYNLTDAVDIDLPENFTLEQNYPNPFNPSTRIKFELKSQGHVSLKIFNALGKEITTLINEVLSAGSHSVDFNTNSTNNISSGVYFYELSGEEGRIVKKMILNK